MSNLRPSPVADAWPATRTHTLDRPIGGRILAKRTSRLRSAPAPASESPRDLDTQRAQAVSDESPVDPSTPAGDVLGDFAEDLGKLLGTAQAKASSWLDQRKIIAEQLAQIRDTANHYLQQLTSGNAAQPAAARVVRRGRPPGSRVAKASAAAAPPSVTSPKRGRPAGGRKRGGMSPEGRARVAAAQRARWAKVRAARDTGK
jgi:hypothetical protein